MSNVVILVSQLKGEALDYAVAMAVHGVKPSSAHAFAWKNQNPDPRNYSTSPDIGMPLLHKHAVALEPADAWQEYGNSWQATCITTRADADHSFHHQQGDTPLIAGMRAIVGAILGDTIEVPSELLEQSA